MDRNLEKWDIAVLGAGAAGCMAAITAAGYGARVLLLEQNDRIGKKIPATGNGKCNFTNTNMNVDAFRGSRVLAENVLAQFGLDDTLSFFHGIGILPKCKNGYYYPNSQTASSVRNALEMQLIRNGVDIKTGIKITKITSFIEDYDEAKDPGTAKNFDVAKDSDAAFNGSSDANNNHAVQENGFRIISSGGVFICNKLIIATGLLASPKLGSNGSSFRLIEKLGHHFTDIVPALCGFYAMGLDFKKVAGVRTDARVTLYIDGKEARAYSDESAASSQELSCQMPSLQKDGITGKYFRTVTDTGELQLTEYGISGIPVFQISRYASYALLEGKEAQVEIDFLPGLSEDEVREEIMRRFDAQGQAKYFAANGASAPRGGYEVKEMPPAQCNAADSMFTRLNGLLNEKLLAALLKSAGISLTAVTAEIPPHKIEKLCMLCKRCLVTLTKPRDFEYAQVCAGGIRSEEVDSRTLESKIVPGLYFAGEILDVDGICGGYNLQWAWSSGYVAGRAATAGQ